MRHSLRLAARALRCTGPLARSFGKRVRMPTRALATHAHTVALTPGGHCASISERTAVQTMNYIHFLSHQRGIQYLGNWVSLCVFFPSLSLSLSLFLSAKHTHTHSTSSLFTTHLFTVHRDMHTHQTHGHLSLHSSPRGGAGGCPMCVQVCV